MEKERYTARRLARAVEAYFATLRGQSPDGHEKTPSVAGLCLQLGITREELAQYAAQEDTAAVLSQARMHLEDYWTEQLAGKGTTGAKFALVNDCGWTGWREKGEMDEAPAPPALQMSLDEKLNLVQQAAAQFLQDEQKEADGCRSLTHWPRRRSGIWSCAKAATTRFCRCSRTGTAISF